MAATVNRGGAPDYDSPGFILCTLLAVAAAILLAAGLGCLLYYGPAYPYYYVAIDSASGLLDGPRAGPHPESGVQPHRPHHLG